MLRGEALGKNGCLHFLTLADGSFVGVKELIATMEKLKKLCESNGLALYQLMKACKTKDSLLKVQEDLKNKISFLGLLENDGTIARIVKQVVINGVAEEGRSVKIVNPVKGSSVSWDFYRKMVE